MQEYRIYTGNGYIQRTTEDAWDKYVGVYCCIRSRGTDTFNSIYTASRRIFATPTCLFLDSISCRTNASVTLNMISFRGNMLACYSRFVAFIECGMLRPANSIFQINELKDFPPLKIGFLFPFCLSPFKVGFGNVSKIPRTNYRYCSPRGYTGIHQQALGHTPLIRRCSQSSSSNGSRVFKNDHLFPWRRTTKSITTINKGV